MIRLLPDIARNRSLRSLPFSRSGSAGIGLLTTSESAKGLICRALSGKYPLNSADEIVRHSAAEILGICEMLLEKSTKAHIPVRLVGSAAVLYRCQNIVRLQFFAHRAWKDVDLVCPPDSYRKAHDFLSNLGFQSDYRLEAVTDGRRAVFYSPSFKMLVDLFAGELRFSHTLRLKGRILNDPYTVSLADLLLSKLQRIGARESDMEDMLLLLGLFDIGNKDGNSMNLNRIVSVLSQDWGFYQTACENLTLVEDFSRNVKDNEIERLKGKAMENRSRILAEINGSPKSVRWKLRSILGKRIKWYSEVDSTEIF
jgi:hypothetical protein